MDSKHFSCTFVIKLKPMVEIKKIEVLSLAKIMALV